LTRRRENDERRKKEEDNKVPVTVVTGFLGSGKTTLLNRILSEQHGKRIAVIENEFGEVGIDASLVEQTERTTETIVEMNNGCICCTLRGDFIEGMQKVLKDVQARGSHLDGVLIETTGLADPSPIASTFFLDQFMQQNYRLDSILGVCDAKHLLSQLSGVRDKACVNEASEQVAFSDRLLLTKTDLCSEIELSDVLERMQSVNPFAKVLPMNLKDKEVPIPVQELCDIKAFSLDRALDFDATFLDDEDDHVHDAAIKALGVKLRGSLNQDRLNAFFAEVLKRYPKEMYRMKGILDVRGIEERYVFHAVNCHFGGVPQGTWSSDDVRESRAVFIGRGIDYEWLVGQLKLCFEEPSIGILESNLKAAHA
jgi:G3E family GTPase